MANGEGDHSNVRQLRKGFQHDRRGLDVGLSMFSGEPAVWRKSCFMLVGATDDVKAFRRKYLDYGQQITINQH